MDLSSTNLTHQSGVARITEDNHQYRMLDATHNYPVGVARTERDLTITTCETGVSTRTKVKEHEISGGEMAGVVPVIRWAGGKRAQVSLIASLAPAKYAAYHEPFLGGGAAFFGIMPKKALLSDCNWELITFYQVVRDRLGELLVALEEHECSEVYYRSIRSLDPRTFNNPVRVASRFLYLNRCNFNGLYRVNRRGFFNVPYGFPAIRPGESPHEAWLSRIREDELHCAAALLKRANLHAGDYRVSFAAMEPGDWCYADPPYVPLKDDSFHRYTADGFGVEAQKKLAHHIRSLVGRGVYVLASNSDTPLVRELYAGFTIIPVQARRAINRNGAGRGPVGEVLIVTYTPGHSS